MGHLEQSCITLRSKNNLQTVNFFIEQLLKGYFEIKYLVQYYHLKIVSAALVFSEAIAGLNVIRIS